VKCGGTGAIGVIYRAHVHRRDGCDMGLFDDSHPPIANRAALVDGTPGVNIYPELAPAPGEHVIKKHRYSGFFGTDLDIILREWGVDTVIIAGTTTENCCHATARHVSQLPGRLSVGCDCYLCLSGPRIWHDASRCSPPRHAGDPRGINGPCDVSYRHEGAYITTCMTPVVGHVVWRRSP